MTDAKWLTWNKLVLALVGPAFSGNYGTCEFSPLPEQPVRYECLAPVNYQGIQMTYVLVGRENWPFVWPPEG